MCANTMLITTADVLKKETKAKEDKFIDGIIVLEKKKKELDNIVYKMALGYQNPLYLTKAQRKQPALYCGHTIVKKHDVLFMPDIEERLELAATSRGKMLEKQNDPIAKEKNVIIKLIDHDALKKLSDHFSAHFVELSAEQAFWLPISKPTCEKPPFQPEQVSKKISRELPTISLAKEINEMKEVFNQMEFEVDNFSVERNCFEIKAKELLLENERLLEHIVYQDVLCITMHVDAAINCVVPKIGDTLAYAEMEHSYIDEYNKVLELEAKLLLTYNIH
ncbi:hypothetical protein Tco_0370804 [Tanacetum coccineum]